MNLREQFDKVYDHLRTGEISKAMELTKRMESFYVIEMMKYFEFDLNNPCLNKLFMVNYVTHMHTKECQCHHSTDLQTLH